MKLFAATALAMITTAGVALAAPTPATWAAAPQDMTQVAALMPEALAADEADVAFDVADASDDDEAPRSWRAAKQGLGGIFRGDDDGDDDRDDEDDREEGDDGDDAEGADAGDDGADD